MSNPKTITVAMKGSTSRTISKAQAGWPLPPEEGYGAYVSGTGAKKEAVERWKEAGWSVARVPNPRYRAPRLFSF